MPDPQPTTAAMRLGRVADMAIHGTPHAIREKRIALALDDAGVGVAVARLKNARIAIRDRELTVALCEIDDALAALTGDDDAK